MSLLSFLLMFILFPLVVAEDLFADPNDAVCVCVCVLAYWLLVRLIAGGQLSPAYFEVSEAWPEAWSTRGKMRLSSLIKVFLGYAIMEEMEFCGTPYHWTASGSEALHRILQFQVPQCTTNYEESVVKVRICFQLCLTANNIFKLGLLSSDSL